MPPSVLLVVLLIPTMLVASEAADRECLRYNDAVSKVQKTYDEALTKEKARTIANLVALAKREAKPNAPAATSEVWKAVLTLDQSNVEARKFFQASGQLDAVLAELKMANSVDLLGERSDAPAAGDGAGTSPAPRVDGSLLNIAAVAGHKTGLGPLKAGTTLTFQYVSGAWTSQRADGAMHNPDAAVTPARFRVRLTSDPTNTDATLAVVPAGTVQSPYTLKLETDCDKLYLCMNTDSAPDTRDGQVQYRVRVVAP